MGAPWSAVTWSDVMCLTTSRMTRRTAVHVGADSDLPVGAPATRSGGVDAGGPHPPEVPVLTLALLVALLVTMTLADLAPALLPEGSGLVAPVR
jgi:hypothetical protein